MTGEDRPRKRPTSRDREDALLHPRAEYPMDVARAYTRLVLNVVFVRYPNNRWLLAHAGSVVPFVTEWVGKTHYTDGAKLRWWRIIKDLMSGRNGGLELARGGSYDTAGAADPVTLTALRRLVPRERIRFGSNYPWASVRGLESALRLLETDEVRS